MTLPKYDVAPNGTPWTVYDISDADLAANESFVVVATALDTSDRMSVRTDECYDSVEIRMTETGSLRVLDYQCRAAIRPIRLVVGTLRRQPPPATDADAFFLVGALFEPKSMAGRLTAALDALEPRPRLVDWSILACVLVETGTGILSLGAGAPATWPLFWIHRVVGLALVVLVFFKLRRVKSRLRREMWERSTAISVLLAVVAVAALATGVAWVLGADVDLAFWTLLNVHIGLGLLVVPLVAVHLLSRYRPVRRVDFEGRRTALQYGFLLVGGAVVYRLQELTAVLAETSGATRRFTGSKPVGGPDGDGVGGSFPVTSWVADDPTPLDRDDWRLRIDGLVDSPLDFGYEDVDAGAETTALLDCTSGWYTVQVWRGVRLGSVLDAAGVAGVDAGAETAAGSDSDGRPRWVTVHSVTGYRWSFPLEEARGMLLATHVGDERLSHGHGAPLRLVAPDRRGFQWVKWVTRIEVRRRRDASQYLATLVSGLD